LDAEEQNPLGQKSKIGILEARPGVPLRFVEDPTASPPSVSEERSAGARAVADSLKAYREAAKSLLAGKYQDFSHLVPKHLREKCEISVICCNDGIIVRYDKTDSDTPKVRAGSIDALLATVAPGFSDGLIHFPADPASYTPAEDGVKAQMFIFDPATGASNDILTFRPLIYVLPQPSTAIVPSRPPHRPICLASVLNELEVMLGGEVLPADTTLNQVESRREFVTRSVLELPVAWLAVEFYPPTDVNLWKPEFAPLWAETDLLAAVARAQLRNTQFAKLDPHVAARKHFAQIIAELGALLEGPEEPAHQFLKLHPELLSPTHAAFWSKLALGDRVTDFVFRGPTKEYLLVEIESPLRELFRKDGQQRQELTHAFDQIIDWRIFLENNLSYCQTELGLTGISANPEALIVIGRSADLSDENRRKLVTLQSQIPKLRIMTYDDLIENAKAVAENLFGPLNLVGYNVETYFKPVAG
jgi:hypothetical protein